MADYVKMARQEASAAAEAAIQARAAELERIDTEKVRLAKLAAEHGLPADASPRAISDAMMAKQEKHRAVVRANHGPWVDPAEHPVGSVGAGAAAV
jgi:hypothetical protein